MSPKSTGWVKIYPSGTAVPVASALAVKAGQSVSNLVFVKPDALADGWSRDRILSEIAEAGYPALSGSCSEIYLEKCFQDAGLAPAERLPVARELGETSLMFLVHPTITPEQMAGYAGAVRAYR